MQFTKIVGNINNSITRQCERILSDTFADFMNKVPQAGSGLGEDPFVFSLVFPNQHYLTDNITRFGTDGVRYYWNPTFILQSSKASLRLACSHLVFHAYFSHKARRGTRDPEIWDIASDYKNNFFILKDLSSRGISNAVDIFEKHVGPCITLKMLAEAFKNPTKKLKLPELKGEQYEYPYADMDMPTELDTVEKIYDYIVSLQQKQQGGAGKGSSQNQSSGGFSSSSFGGMGGSPGNSPGNKGNGKGQPQNNGQGNGQQSSLPKSLPSTMDTHMDIVEQPQVLAAKLANAISTFKALNAGNVPAGLEDYLDDFMDPQITVWDVIRTKSQHAIEGKDRNDWSKFKTRPLFAGLFVPKRKDVVSVGAVLIDTSGSMDIRNDITFGVSQLQSLNCKAELYITCADAEIYWDKTIKLSNLDKDGLKEIKPIGRGGTVFLNYFNEYKEHIKEDIDFIIVITDGYLFEDLNKVARPDVDVIWIITSGQDFKPPFGRVFDLKSGFEKD